MARDHLYALALGYELAGYRFGEVLGSGGSGRREKTAPMPATRSHDGLLGRGPPAHLAIAAGVAFAALIGLLVLAAAFLSGAR